MEVVHRDSVVQVYDATEGLLEATELGTCVTECYLHEGCAALSSEVCSCCDAIMRKMMGVTLKCARVGCHRVAKDCFCSEECVGVHWRSAHASCSCNAAVKQQATEEPGKWGRLLVGRAGT